MNNQDKKKNLQVCFTSIATSDAIAFDDLSIFATIKFFHSTIIKPCRKIYMSCIHRKRKFPEVILIILL